MVAVKERELLFDGADWTFELMQKTYDAIEER